jgi:hypothetical protein
MLGALDAVTSTATERPYRFGEKEGGKEEEEEIVGARSDEVISRRK